MSASAQILAHLIQSIALGGLIGALVGLAVGLVLFVLLVDNTLRRSKIRFLVD